MVDQNIPLIIDCSTDFKPDMSLLVDIFNVVKNEAKLHPKAWASIYFCNTEEMRSLNKRYLGKDDTTDVLSFPWDYKNINTNKNNDYYIGEIIIDINFILTNYKKKNFKSSLIKIVIHGLLHLLGYDHLNSKEKEKMSQMESIIYSKLKR